MNKDRERGDTENSIELVQPDQPTDDVFARTECDQAVPARFRLVADLGADELGRGGGNLAHPRLEQDAELFHARFAAAGAQDVSNVRTHGSRGNREELDTYRFGKIVPFDLQPGHAEPRIAGRRPILPEE